VAGAPANAIPAPNGTNPSRKCQYEASVPSVEKITKPVAISDRPTPPVTRKPKRSAIRGVTLESGITTAATDCVAPAKSPILLEDQSAVASV
jgi:hypothetical protein